MAAARRLARNTLADSKLRAFDYFALDVASHLQFQVSAFREEHQERAFRSADAGHGVYDAVQDFFRNQTGADRLADFQELLDVLHVRSGQGPALAAKADHGRADLDQVAIPKLFPPDAHSVDPDS